MYFRKFSTIALSFIAASSAMVSEAESYAKKYLTIEQAQIAAFPDARFEEISIDEISRRVRSTELSERVRFFKVLSKQNDLLGYFVFDATIGKHLLIDYSVALSITGDVLGVEILEYREDYGGKISENWWKSQFVKKSCNAPISVGEDIKHISGGTLSSKHITDGVKSIACAASELSRSYS